MFIYIYIYIHICIHIYLYLTVIMSSTRAHTHWHIYTHIHTLAHTHTHTRTHKHTHVHTHTCTYTLDALPGGGLYSVTRLVKAKTATNLGMVKALRHLPFIHLRYVLQKCVCVCAWRCVCVCTQNVECSVMPYKRNVCFFIYIASATKRSKFGICMYTEMCACKTWKHAWTHTHTHMHEWTCGTRHSRKNCIKPTGTYAHVSQHMRMIISCRHTCTQHTAACMSKHMRMTQI
jgi:hypothetical protein